MLVLCQVALQVLTGVHEFNLAGETEYKEKENIYHIGKITQSKGTESDRVDSA